MGGRWFNSWACNAEHWNWRTKEVCKCLHPFAFPWSLRVKYPTTLVNFQKLLPNQKILWRIIVNIMNFSKLIKLLDGYVLKWPRYYGSVVIHINYIIWVHSQLFSVFLKEPYKLGHQHFFGLPVAKWKQLRALLTFTFQFIYMGVELWANHMR
jgi:hypothetical protein